MRFIRSADPSLGQNRLSSLLKKSLAKGPVLYLLSGGSNIQIEIAILKSIDPELTANLNMLLVDERYGPKGHDGSNYLKLITQGLDLKRANFPDILTNNLTLAETASGFSQVYEEFKNQSEVIIGQLGIGSDGHIAGVLPHSPGVSSSQTVVYYESNPYQRISLSLKTLTDLDKVYVFCFGASKKPALERLRAGEQTTMSLPSLILKEIADVTVYNDQL